eukprot:m.130509 g.130509  ORF g.130509 m.130509 type:complete len:236 (-) comp13900_c0_seq12:657-1364(-)
MLSRGTPMTSFTLCSCSFGAETRKSQFGDNAMRHLAAALKNNHTLTFLGLRSYFRGTKLTPCSAEDIVEVLNGCTALKTLDLARNSIQDAGVIPVAQALRVNTCLEELDLEDNSIGKGGAQHLAEMLLMNKAIRRLNLHHNCLEEEEGAVQLLESVRRQRGYFVEFGELEMTEIRMYKPKAHCIHQHAQRPNVIRYSSFFKVFFHFILRSPATQRRIIHCHISEPDAFWPTEMCY